MPLPTLQGHAQAIITIDQERARITIDLVDLERIIFDAVSPDGPERHHPSPPAYEEFWSRSASPVYGIHLHIHTAEKRGQA